MYIILKDHKTEKKISIIVAACHVKGNEPVVHIFLFILLIRLAKDYPKPKECGCT